MKTIIDNWLTVAILIGVTGCTINSTIETLQGTRRSELEEAYVDNFKATLDLIDKRSEQNTQLIREMMERKYQ